MLDLGVFVIILIALAIGFLVGRLSIRQKAKPSPSPFFWPQKRYFEGLTYLLNEEADEAIDQFIADMGVTSETLDVHLSLGALLRRKGEFARAVKVHQNLLARTALGAEQLQLVQLELAKDYIQSGLLDRAENLLIELVEHRQLDKHVRQEGLECLIDIYEDTHEWLKAIDVADCLTLRKFSSHSDYWKMVQAQYSCELSLEASAKCDWHESQRWVKSALRYDKNCVRATLLLAKMEMKNGKYPVAIADLKMIPHQNADLATEMLLPLVECYEHLGGVDELRFELVTYIETYSDKRALNILYRLLLDADGANDGVVAMLSAFLPRFPHMKVTFELIQAMQYVSRHDDIFELIKPSLDALLHPEVYYECTKCGFTGNEMHWRCPGCKGWSTQVMLA